MRLWRIEGNVVHEHGGWTGSTGVPTFYLDPDIQGIVNGDHACRIARKIIDPFELLGVHVTAVAVTVDGRDTIPEVDTYVASSFRKEENDDRRKNERGSDSEG